MAASGGKRSGFLAFAMRGEDNAKLTNLANQDSLIFGLIILPAGRRATNDLVCVTSLNSCL